MASRRKKRPPKRSRPGPAASSRGHEVDPNARSRSGHRPWAPLLRWLRGPRGATRLERKRPRSEVQRGADKPTTLDVLQARFFPEGRGASTRVRVRAWAISAVIALLVTAGGFAGTYAYDLWSAEARLREERAAQTTIDQGSPPFTNAVAYDTSLPESFEVVLDRPLTTEQAEELGTLERIEAWDFLEALGGRLIPHTFTTGHLTPPGGWSWEGAPTTTRVGTAVFTMTLMSARSSQVSIVDMEPVNISCAEPTATTVVNFPTAGEAAYSGVVVDLTHDAPMLLISDEGLEQGQPYFSRRRIDVGGGLEPGGLRVEAVTAGQTCEWEIRARHVDARENSGEVVLRDGDEPFRVEAPPENPEQYWAMSIGPRPVQVVACHETPEALECPNPG